MLFLKIIDVVIPDIIISGGTCYFWIGLRMFDGFYRQFWFDKCPQLWQNINENLAINFIRNWSKTRVWVRLLQLSGNSINPWPTIAAVETQTCQYKTVNISNFAPALGAVKTVSKTKLVPELKETDKQHVRLQISKFLIFIFRITIITSQWLMFVGFL